MSYRSLPRKTENANLLCVFCVHYENIQNILLHFVHNGTEIIKGGVFFLGGGDATYTVISLVKHTITSMELF